MKLRIRRSKWLRGSASHLFTADGCGCIIGHYLVAKGVPKEKLYYNYGFGAHLEPYEGKMDALGEFIDDEWQPYFSPTFSPTETCNDLIWVNDGDLGSIHDFHVAPINNDQQREAVLIRLMAKIGCELKFVGQGKP